MLPDSTVKDTKKKKQKNSERASDDIEGLPVKKAKKQKKIKKILKRKQKTRNGESDDELAEFDLGIQLHPIGYYVKDRKEMVKQIFSSLKKQKIIAMLPDILKKYSMEDLESMCCDQLAIMSKKRITSLIEGKRNEDISSSGTDEELSNHNGAVSDIEITEKGRTEHPDSTIDDRELRAGEECRVSTPQPATSATESTNTDMNKLELLELELRARAIKKLLNAQCGGGQTCPDLTDSERQVSAKQASQTEQLENVEESASFVKYEALEPSERKEDLTCPLISQQSFSGNFHRPTHHDNKQFTTHQLDQKYEDREDTANILELKVGDDEYLSDSEFPSEKKEEDNITASPHCTTVSFPQKIVCGKTERSITPEITSQRYKQLQERLSYEKASKDNERASSRGEINVRHLDTRLFLSKKVVNVEDREMVDEHTKIQCSLSNSELSSPARYCEIRAQCSGRNVRSPHSKHTETVDMGKDKYSDVKTSNFKSRKSDLQNYGPLEPIEKDTRYSNEKQSNTNFIESQRKQHVKIINKVSCYSQQSTNTDITSHDSHNQTSSKVKTYEQMPSRKVSLSSPSALIGNPPYTKKYKRSPVRFPSPDLEIVQVPSKKTPPTIVLSDSD